MFWLQRAIRLHFPLLFSPLSLFLFFFFFLFLFLFFFLFFPMPRKRKVASKETFGAECCDRPRFVRVSGLLHPDGPVYRCSARHTTRYFVVPSPEGGLEVFRSDLKARGDADAAVAPAPNPPGRAAGVPPGKRALLPCEREAVEAAIKAPGADEEKRTSHRFATLAEGGTWLSDPHSTRLSRTHLRQDEA